MDRKKFRALQAFVEFVNTKRNKNRDRIMLRLMQAKFGNEMLGGEYLTFYEPFLPTECKATLPKEFRRFDFDHISSD